jgi:hypothetical protein
MKRLLSHIAVLLIIITFMLSCDFVQNANPPIEPTAGGGVATNIFVSDSNINQNAALRKAFVEDYTGHKCGNCPAAALELKNIESAYSGKIVAVAIHAGFFAKTNVTYPTDFNTIAGKAYDDAFGISIAGNPNGLVNRVGYGTGGFIKGYSAWGGEVAAQTTLSPKFQITMKYKYDSGSLKMNVDVKVKSLANNTGTYKVVVLLTEDSIIAEQLDYSLPPGSQLIPDYEFDHLLRGSVNSEWGDAIFTGGAPLNSTETKFITNYQISSTYKIKKCHLIAYIYDANNASPTNYEVLQVEELKLK